MASYRNEADVGVKTPDKSGVDKFEEAAKTAAETSSQSQFSTTKSVGKIDPDEERSGEAYEETRGKPSKD